MKNIKLLFLVCFSSTICNSQITNENELLLSRTFRYLHHQNYLINHIKEKFPDLGNEATFAELEFERTYNIAIANVFSKTKELFGQNYIACLDKLKKEIALDYEPVTISRQDAVTYINSVRKGCLGKIQSPILETIFKYQYLNNPLKEYLDNHVKIYSVASYSNTNKIELKVKIPMSWKEVDGVLPSTLKKFKSEYATGNEILTIRKRSSNIGMASIKNELKKNAPTTAQLLGLHLQKINSKKTGVIHYEETESISNTIQKKQTILYIIDTGRTILEIEFVLIGDSSDNLNANFKKINPLFQAITQSIYTSDHKFPLNNVLSYNDY